MSKITIAFPQGGIIPGTVLGKSEDVHVDAQAPITVPERYGRHLIADRFAIEVAAPEKPKKKAKASAGEKAGAVDQASLLGAISQEDDIDGGDTDEADGADGDDDADASAAAQA